jgi:positive regulator of sigma E activity
MPYVPETGDSGYNCLSYMCAIGGFVVGLAMAILLSGYEIAFLALAVLVWITAGWISISLYHKSGEKRKENAITSSIALPFDVPDHEVRPL